ncbi:hypothetical protein TcWFU_004357 [Taenia crassiceps]|uniref:Uncharacterized protein n=1 Tax=Taenia crassiceps TaxID=6207 RepID=A0ABR4QKU5_9CEST
MLCTTRVLSGLLFYRLSRPWQRRLSMRPGLRPYRVGPHRLRPSQNRRCFSPAAPANSSSPQMTHIVPSHKLLSVYCLQQNTDQSTSGPSRECYGLFTEVELDSSFTVPVLEHKKTSQMLIPYVVNWKGRCSVDPWESIKPTWIPDGVLFSPLQQKF